MSSDSDGGSIPTGSPPPTPSSQPSPAASFPTSPGVADIPPDPAPDPESDTESDTESDPAPDTESALDAAGSGSEIGPGDVVPKKKPGSFFRELPILILIAFGLALLIKSLLIQAFYIPSESMVPTLNVGDRVLVNKIVYKIRDPRRGEVIVFVGRRDPLPRSFWQRVRDTLTSGLGGKQGPETDFIKRIIGLPGETVQIDSGRVSITPANGGAVFSLDEPYLAQQADRQSYGPYTVPKDAYFVMGDNRANSSDSRSSLGFIDRKEIVGRAFVRIWPARRFHRLTRPVYSMGLGAPVLLWMRRRPRILVS